MAPNEPDWIEVLSQHSTAPSAEDLRQHWNFQRSLAIFSNAQRVGFLNERAGTWELQYVHEWITSPQAWDLAPGLPRAAGTITDDSTKRPVQWFFDNLLPEEAMRTAVAKTAVIDQADAFSLLTYLGRESAGALVLLPPGEDPGEVAQPQPLTLQDLSERIANMPKVPIAATAPKRMSLAGAQQKLLVRWDGKNLSEPLGAAPSTHILKPQSDSLDYPHSVINEFAMMRLARAVGLNVPPVWRLYAPQPVYIVERFDRVKDEDGYQRLQAIDTCQLLNMPRQFKYKNATLMTMSEAVEKTRARASTRQQMWRWLIFNMLIGNHDNHLKNISFMISPEGADIAKAYDLLCTAVYHSGEYNLQPRWPGVEMAIPAPEAPTFADLTRERVLRAAEVLGMPRTTAARELDAMRNAILQQMDQIIAAIGDENETTPPEAKQYHGGELALLRAIRHVVIQDMVKRLG